MTKVLVTNLGSTSLKMKLLDMADERPLAMLRIERIGSSESPMIYQAAGRKLLEDRIPAPSFESALRYALEMIIDQEHGPLDSIAELDAIGFKAVHAGDFYGPTLVTDQLIELMDRYSPIAPGHNPVYIKAMQFLKQELPSTPQIAFFETSFHRTIPDYAWIYSVPYEWYEQYGVRRYGFHSASFYYLAERVPTLLEREHSELRLVACHLGGSSSVGAIANGISMDTSMGFTPQSGVPMGQRSGDFDPFVILHIMETAGLTVSQVREKLTQQSGLLGISGISPDVRDLEAAASQGNSRAGLALQAYAYAVKKYIGAYAAALGGIDALVFSGGIGENSPALRARICQGLEFLGIDIHPRINAACRGLEACISTEGSSTPVWVVPTDEELIVARQAVRVLRIPSINASQQGNISHVDE